MKKPPLSYDYEHRLMPDLLRFLERIEDIEKLHRELSSSNKLRDLKWNASSSEYKRKLNRFRETIKELNEKTDEIKHRFISCVNEFRKKAAKEDLDKLKKKADRFMFEDLITIREFKKMLNENA